MGRVKVMTGEAPLQENLQGTFVDQATASAGTASDIFATISSLSTLEDRAVLLEHFHPSTQNNHNICMVLDGGSASLSVCLLDTPSTTPTLPNLTANTYTEDTSSSQYLVIDIIDPIDTLTSRSNDPVGTIAFSNDTRQIVVFKNGGYDTWTETSN